MTSIVYKLGFQGKNIEMCLAGFADKNAWHMTELKRKGIAAGVGKAFVCVCVCLSAL